MRVQGLRYTDVATEQFIQEIEVIDKRVTVVFFGNHLLEDVFTVFGEDGIFFG